MELTFLPICTLNTASRKSISFFVESGRFFPLDFYGLSWSLERTFGKNLEALFKEYQKSYIQEALKQKSLPEKALFSSQTDLPLNSDENHIYFLISNKKSTPKLVVMKKATEKVHIQGRIDLPLGKVFYRGGAVCCCWQAVAQARSSIEFSLFREGFKPLKEYNSKSVMDLHKKKVISLDTRQSHTGNAILLNDSFYDHSHSSAIMDHKGRIYYFKQKGSLRTLYRDKKALFSFSSYSAYPVEADMEGLYFIASVPYGSSLFIYKEGKGIFRLSQGDRLTYARKIRKNTFLVSELHPFEIQYKIIKTEERPELPFLYTYSFKKQSLFSKLKGLTLPSHSHIVEKQEHFYDQKAVLAPNEEDKEKGLEKDDSRQREKGIFKAEGYPGQNLIASPGWDVQAYKPIAFLKLYQISFLPYPSLRYLYNFQFPESFKPQRLVSDFYFLSLFQFSDPLHFNTLDVQSFFGFQPSHKKFFKLSYSYHKYRPSFSLFFSYENSPISQRHFNKFKNLGFLRKSDLFKQDKSLKSSIPHKDTSIGFAVKYPLFLKPYSDLSLRSELQLGWKQFHNRKKNPQSDFFLSLKALEKLYQTRRANSL